jgi:uncharacterized repeat protein (TIGR03806 family)
MPMILNLFLKQARNCLLLLPTVVILIASCSKGGEEPEPEPGPIEFKETLSSYKFFDGDIKDLQPAEGVFQYELSTPLFSDHTIKDRFIVLPKGKAMGYQQDGIVDFPAGTIIIKTFSSLYPDGNERRLETRLLILDPYDSKWKVMNYLWNDGQTEAVKHLRGANLAITVKDESGTLMNVNYKVPNTNDCKSCHNNNSNILPIGPTIRSLNFTPSFSSKNQLSDWSSKGVLTGLPSSGVPKLPDWNDHVNYTLDQRARAYLDINCAHCHREGGAAGYTGYWVDYDITDSFKLGIYKSPIAAGPGSRPFSYDVVPGKPDSSIVIYRMNSTVPAIAMPETARSIVHEKGVELIREWISSL